MHSRFLSRKPNTANASGSGRGSRAEQGRIERAGVLLGWTVVWK